MADELPEAEFVIRRIREQLEQSLTGIVGQPNDQRLHQNIESVVRRQLMELAQQQGQLATPIVWTRLDQGHKVHIMTCNAAEVPLGCYGTVDPRTGKDILVVDVDEAKEMFRLATGEWVSVWSRHHKFWYQPVALHNTFTVELSTSRGIVDVLTVGCGVGVRHTVDPGSGMTRAVTRQIRTNRRRAAKATCWPQFDDDVGTTVRRAVRGPIERILY